MNKKLTKKRKLSLDKFFESDTFKTFISETKKAKAEDTGTFEMIITTEDVDRMGEVIKADGWDFSHYMKNPVVLWGHDYKLLPIGVTERIEKIDGNRIKAYGKFAPASANPMAQQVRQLYDLGIQNASSVGFMDLEREGNVITKAQLLEWSFVSVPANPMALTTLAKTDLNINEMITKGILKVKEGEPIQNEETSEATETTEAPAEEPKEEVAEAPVEETFEEKVLKELADIKERLVAFESSKDLEGNNEEVEETIETPEDTPEESPKEEINESDEKDFQEFLEKRKILQLASTMLGEVLAETRQAINNRQK